MTAKGEQMRSTAYDFCKSFAAGLSGAECLDKYFTASPKIKEHGPQWAVKRLPFLATTFQGRRDGDRTRMKSCDDYYDLLTSTLTFDPASVVVPSKDKLAVDPEAGVVTVKLHAKFFSLKTGKGWEEDFVYVLSEIDHDGKIGCQEMWTDPLSAWLAVGDELIPVDGDTPS